MTDTTPPTSAPRGTPPNRKQIATHLGARAALWDAVIAMAPEFGAVWRWAHSEATNSWSYRAYMPGERFFIALSLTDTGFETSLNMKPEEWDWVGGAGGAEIDFLEGLKAKALASGDNPAWLHIAIENEASLPALAKLLFARARRVQNPRGKKRR